MQYPLISEYIDAISMAEDNLGELSHLVPVLDKKGKPVMSGGNFAVVFKMQDSTTGKYYALKCFTREQDTRQENYIKIADELSHVSSSYIIGVRYLPKELFVDTTQSSEEEFPVLLMDWVEGQTLDNYLRNNIDQPAVIRKLSDSFNRMAIWLLSQPFAHGDLKSDNIIVNTAGELVLVDYDGMYVPSMKGMKSKEIGSPNFRHPQRSDAWFDETIDDFSLSLMATALYALSLQPALLQQYEAKDAILFTEKDLLNLPQSKLYSSLSALLYDKTFAKLFSALQLSFARVPIRGQYATMFARDEATQEAYKSLYDQAMKLYQTSNNKTEAYQLLSQAADMDFISKHIQVCFKTDEDIKKEKARIETYTSLATNNDATAQLILGECYYFGWGVEQDYKQAVEWYKKSAEQGYAAAQFDLGNCYECGRGVDKDYRKAVEWYERAAKQGNEKAKESLDKLLNPNITYEEQKEAITDEYGVRYTKDGLKLISVPKDLEILTIKGVRYIKVGWRNVPYNSKSYTIKDETKVIAKNAFKGCRVLRSIVIPKGVAKIGSMAFNDCNNPTITCESPLFNVGDGILYSKEGELISCFSTSKDVVIPKDVTKIGECAFAWCSFLRTVVIPDSVTEIGGGAFRGCDYLQTIEIPNSVTEIGAYAFSECRSLRSIVIPNNVTKIKDSAFWSCSSLQTIEIPDSVTEIGGGSFSGCSSLRSIVIPNNVTKIRDSAFWSCSSLQTIEIPDSVTEIGGGSFSRCSSLRTIVIPNSVTKIEDRTFAGCGSLLSIEIPDSVQEIGWAVFDDCSSLQSIVIPDSVTKIGSSAFDGCSSLQTIVIPNGVTEIGGSTFWKCSSLQSIEIPDSVTKIGELAFHGCSSLQTIEIPDSVTEIEWGVFGDCTSLQSVKIPNGVTEVESRTFEGCSSLQSIEILDSVTKIGYRAFCNCSSLQSIEIPNSVTEIRDWAFFSCSSLQSVEIPNGVTEIGECTFHGCRSLHSIVIPDSVTKIGEAAFHGCRSLQSVKIPDSVIEIGDRAFEGCTSLNR